MDGEPNDDAPAQAPDGDTRGHPGGARSGDRADERTRPDHDAIVQAVARAGDSELADWVARPSDYVVRPVEVPPARNHDFSSLTPLGASHPIAVLLCRDRRDGALDVVSGRPDVVWRLLDQEPPLAVPEWVTALVAPTYDDWQYLGPAGDGPALVATEDGWEADLLVSEAGAPRPERWRVRLSREDAHLRRRAEA